MRIREPFAKERISEERNYNKKCFIISEGEVTEPRYFEKLNNSPLSESTTIINILRDYAKLGYSNPSKIIKLVDEFLDNRDECITIKELKNKLDNFKHENNIKFDVQKLKAELDNVYNSTDKITVDELKDLLSHLFAGDIYKDILKNFSKYVMAQNTTYVEGVDNVNLVVDRDPDSFTKEQYDEVLNYCKSHNINLYVSNPNFEFWLYLHFKEVESEDRKVLLKNPKIGSKRYIEKKLYDLCGYSKAKFNFGRFEPKIKDAIKREKMYEENLEKLKDNLGTNVGKLVNEIINNNSI